MPNANHQKGYAFFKDKNFKEALKYYNLAVQEEPNNPNIVSDRAVLYFHMEDRANALADINKSVELDPEYSYRYASRAYIREWLGDIRGAVKDYEKAVQLDPEDDLAYNNLGLLLEKLGRKTAAKRQFERSDELRKNKNGTPKEDILEPVEEVKEEEKKIVPPINVQREINKENRELQSKGKAGIIKDTLTKKGQFKEFLQFIKNGFKIK